MPAETKQNSENFTLTTVISPPVSPNGVVHAYGATQIHLKTPTMEDRSTLHFHDVSEQEDVSVVATSAITVITYIQEPKIHGNIGYVRIIL